MTKCVPAILLCLTWLSADARAQNQNLGAGAGNIAVAAPTPLAAHPQGQQMMAQAAQNVSLLDINFTFLNKTYENDQYTEALGQRVRTSCIRFKVNSGFKFRVDPPKFTLTTQGLTIEQNIPKLSADALAVKFQLGPCQDISGGVGVRISDVKVTYKARLSLSFDQNNVCKLNWNHDYDDLSVTIGDVNFLGVQNDIEKLAKDAAREAVNLSLDTLYSTVLRSELTKATLNVCGQTGARSPVAAPSIPGRRR